MYGTLVDCPPGPAAHAAGDPDAPERAAVEAKLIEMRAALLARLDAARERLPAQPSGVMDFEDACVEDVAQDMETVLAEMSCRTVRRIDEALRRLAMGTYGECGRCGLAIAEARLVAVPFAEHCLACEEEAEETAPSRPPLRSVFQAG
jgi:DnaK suppressor protein